MRILAALCAALVLGSVPFEQKGRAVHVTEFHYGVTVPAGEWKPVEAQNYDAVFNGVNGKSVGVRRTPRTSPRAFMVGFALGAPEIKELSRAELAHPFGEALEAQLSIDGDRMYLRVVCAGQQTYSLVGSCPAAQYDAALPEFKAFADSLVQDADVARALEQSHPSVTSVGATLTSTTGFRLTLPSKRWYQGMMNSTDVVVVSTDGVVARVARLDGAEALEVVAGAAVDNYRQRAGLKALTPVSAQAVKLGTRDAYRVVMTGPTELGDRVFVGTAWREAGATFVTGTTYLKMMAPFANPDLDALHASIAPTKP